MRVIVAGLRCRRRATSERLIGPCPWIIRSTADALTLRSKVASPVCLIAASS